MYFLASILFGRRRSYEENREQKTENKETRIRYCVSSIASQCTHALDESVLGIVPPFLFRQGDLKSKKTRASDNGGAPKKVEKEH
jgi:hypothetical protein